MKIFYFLVAFLTAIATSFAAKIPSTITKETNISASPQASILIQQSKATPGYAVSALTMQDLQQALGRKLSLKEKVGWYLYKKHLHAEEPTEKAVKKANSNAVLGFVFSLASLLIPPLAFVFYSQILLLFSLLAIPALILSINALVAGRVNPGILTKSNRSLAKAGKIISYIILALIFIVLIMILAYIGG